MSPPLDPAFLEKPLAHRGLHDRASGVIENSAAAVHAAVEAGYGVEVDLQMSADGEAMVFHDHTLERLTGQEGPVRALSSGDLGRIELTGSDETIPKLVEVMDIVRGRAPLLIEIKDQSRALSPVDGRLERRVCRLLAAYNGPVAVMSFNPHSVAACRDTAKEIARGRVTMRFSEEDWPEVPEARRSELDKLNDLDALGASFISHEHAHLDQPAVARVADSGLPILCWTVKSREQETIARRIASNVTFEDYRP